MINVIATGIALRARVLRAGVQAQWPGRYVAGSGIEEVGLERRGEMLGEDRSAVFRPGGVDEMKGTRELRPEKFGLKPKVAFAELCG